MGQAERGANQAGGGQGRAGRGGNQRGACRRAEGWDVGRGCNLQGRMRSARTASERGATRANAGEMGGAGGGDEVGARGLHETHLPCTCEILSEVVVDMSFICESIQVQAGQLTEQVTLPWLAAKIRFAARGLGLQHRTGSL